MTVQIKPCPSLCSCCYAPGFFHAHTHTYEIIGNLCAFWPAAAASTAGERKGLTLPRRISQLPNGLCRANTGVVVIVVRTSKLPRGEIL